MLPLTQEIAGTFPAGAPPKQLSRYPGNGHDATQFFTGKRWIDVSAGELRENSDAVSYFTAEALAYFAPAYMTAYLVDPSALDMAVESFLLNVGAAPTVPSPELERAERIKSLFNVVQREIVQTFVKHYLQTEGGCALGIAEPAMWMYGVNGRGGF